MKNIKKASRYVLAIGIFYILLGLAHLFIAVPLGLDAVKSLPMDAKMPLTMSNIVTALAMIASGLLVVYCSSGIKLGERQAWIISAGTGFFVSVIGIGYIIITPLNPFACLAFIAPVSKLIILCFIRKEVK